MYMRSMTGFGRTEGEACGLFIEITIRSVNHKSLDLQIRMPRRLQAMEAAVRETLQKSIARGRVEVSFLVRSGDTALSQLALDTGRADAVKNALDALIHRYGLVDRVTPGDFFRVPDLFVDTPQPLDEETLKQEVLVLLHEALADYQTMRSREAQGLVRQLEANLSGIRENIKELETALPQILAEAKKKLAEKVEAFLEETPELREARLQQEVLFYIDKSDVREELTRLGSHLDQFEKLLSSDGPAGKKMDFIAQEMNREANTIASKSQHLTQTNAAIALKVHVEQMREQILNLE